MDTAKPLPETFGALPRHDDYPEYSRAERVMDGIIHVGGIVLSLVGFAWLLQQEAANTGSFLSVAVWIYAVCVTLLFIFSAAYHMTPWPQARPILRRFDQSAIFFKIAGTYTPLVAVIAGFFSLSVLVAVWLAAIIGAAFKLVGPHKLGNLTTMVYLAMGWASVLLLLPIAQKFSVLDTSLIVAGGLLYTVGVIFHRAEHINFNNAIWHAFVLMASSMHFLVVARTVVLAGS